MYVSMWIFLAVQDGIDYDKMLVKIWSLNVINCVDRGRQNGATVVGCSQWQLHDILHASTVCAHQHVP